MYSSPFSCDVICTGGYPRYNIFDIIRSQGVTITKSKRSSNIHHGLDFIPKKDTDENRFLYSPVSGKVIESKYNSGGYGNYIVIDGGDIWILMGHMKDLSPYKKGDTVISGAFIGIMGGTGNVTGDHLHIEVSIPTGTGSWWDKHQRGRKNPANYINFLLSSEVIPPEPEEIISYGAELIKLIFNNNYKMATEGDFDMPKTWTNDSGKDIFIYQTVNDCWAGIKSIGTIKPNAVCDCFGVVDGCYLVLYQSSGNNKLVGFTKYFGGIEIPEIE